MGTVVVVGGVNVDLTVHADSRPGGGETVVGQGPFATSGGKGANQAVAAAYVGADARLCASVGGDAAGAEQLDRLRAAGVDVSTVKVVDGTATGTAFILLTPDGENSIVVGTGANASLGRDEVVASIDRDTDLVLAQTEPGPGPVAAAAALAGRHSIRFVLNAAPTTGLSIEVLRQANPLIVNEHEAVDLLREHGVPDPPDLRALARTLREQLGCRSVVVSLGAAGASVVDADADTDTDTLVTAPRVRVVDSTGAGDVLVGVIAARLAQGWDLTQAAQDACATAARAVTSEGARGYLTATS